MRKEKIKILKQVIGMAVDVIEAMDCPNYPYGEFETDYLNDIHSRLVTTYIQLLAEEEKGEKSE